MTAPAAPAWRLVRVSPHHRLWHLLRVGAPRTECGRQYRELAAHVALAEPLPAPRCSVCGPRVLALLAERLALPDGEP